MGRQGGPSASRGQQASNGSRATGSVGVPYGRATDLERAANVVFVGGQRVQHVEGQRRKPRTMVGHVAVGHPRRDLRARGAGVGEKSTR